MNALVTKNNQGNGKFLKKDRSNKKEEKSTKNKSGSMQFCLRQFFFTLSCFSAFFFSHLLMFLSHKKENK